MQHPSHNPFAPVLPILLYVPTPAWNALRRCETRRNLTGHILRHVPGVGAACAIATVSCRSFANLRLRVTERVVCLFVRATGHGTRSQGAQYLISGWFVAYVLRCARNSATFMCAVQHAATRTVNVVRCSPFAGPRKIAEYIRVDILCPLWS